jgi:hypothetical protein
MAKQTVNRRTDGTFATGRGAMSNQCDTRVRFNATGLSYLEYAMNTHRLSGKGINHVGK